MFRFFAIIFFLNISYVSFSQEVIDFPHWLAGTWEIESPTGVSYEEWKLSDNSELIGRTYRLFGNDTLVFDNMRIYNLGSATVYEMFVNCEYDRELMKFSLQKPDDNLWKFENIKSNSPKNINYYRIEENVVYVWTEYASDETACIDFLMKKKK
ncbi:MAG TPA: DUF6265 family protein [Bacteroidales bacterium]|nr:DUF6265 family protein [Bacteroidales bacterium]